MVNKRWLNIVVDGNMALEPYWHEIVSNYLEKIVRCFSGSSFKEEDAYLGLVFYNANSELVDTGHDMQFINWTNDVNKYLETLSSLCFNGNDASQCTMAEGLAEALVMYPKPSDTMTLREYYNAERHCILVAPGDPFPKKMMLCVPMIRKGQVVGQRLQACEADFLEVAQMFGSIAVSLSVITPNSLPIFGAIFNLGNNVLTLANAPTTSYNTGRLTILLSRSFKMAHDALQQNTTWSSPSVQNVELWNIAPSDFPPRVLTKNLQEDKASTSTFEVGFRERIDETSITELVSPHATHQTNVAISSTSSPQMNAYDDIIAQITAANEDDFTPTKKLKSLEDNLNGDHDLFQPDDQLRFDDIYNNFAAQEGLDQVPTSSTRVGSSSELLEGLLNNNNVLINETGNYSLIESQPNSGYKNHMTEFGQMNTVAVVEPSTYVPPTSDLAPTCYPTQISSQPSLDDCQDYVLSWEGSLTGKVQSNRLHGVKAKAFRKATTPLTITNGWTGRLEITSLMPQKAVDYTKSISLPIDYVFFQILQFNNVDLYAFLKSNNLCAKINLLYQSIVLSPTDREQFFFGTIFRRDTLFIEPV